MLSNWLGIAILTLSLLSSPLAGQTSGVIEGIVRDSSAGAMAGASIRIVETKTSAERTLATDEAGRYRAPRLAPGIYRIEVSQSSFQTAVCEGVELAAGRTARLDFQLEIGEGRESVQVTGESPLVSPSASDWGSSVPRQSLEELPLNGRDLFDLSGQEPGASLPSTQLKGMTGGLGAHITVNGARPNQQGYRLDGISMNESTGTAPSSALGNLLGLEGIQELRLVTSPFSAEYGRFSGALFTAISKSGSNQLHGSFYEFFRNSALDARNFFDSPEDNKPQLRQNQFGAMLSGPVKKDKLFLLGNYEGVRSSSGRTVRPNTINADARRGHLPGKDVNVAESVVPYLELYPQPNGLDFGDGTAEFITETTLRSREDYFATKLDWLPSNRWRVAARYTFDDGDTSEPDYFHVYNFMRESRYHLLHTETTYLPSPNTIHTWRAGYSRVGNSEDAFVPESISNRLAFIAGEQLGAMAVTGVSEMGGLRAVLGPRTFVSDDYQFHYELTHIRGAHTLRTGAGYDRIHYYQLAEIVNRGWYRFGSLENLLTGTPFLGDLALPGSDAERNWRQNQFSWFVQDEWRVRSGLSVNLGLRYETYSVPAEKDGKIATLRDPLHDTATTVGGSLFENPAKRNFASRVAIAWSPTRSGKTVIRAGAGMFHDLLGIRELVVAGVRYPPFFQRARVFNAGFPDLLKAAEDASAANAIDGLTYYPVQPYTVQYQFAVERQIGSQTVLRLGYAGNRGIHLPGQVGDINPARPEALPGGTLFFPATAPRLNPALATVSYRLMEFNSFYHGLQAVLQRRWNRGFRVQLKYDWSKSIDETSSNIFEEFVQSDLVPTMFDYRSNRGSSDFDTRHVFAANFSYELPFGGDSGFRKAIGGWEIHGLVQAQSGHWFSPTVGFDRARLKSGVTDFGQRPNTTAATAGNAITGSPDRWFDPLAFSLPEAGFYGDLGRNRLEGPGLAALNFAVHKDLWHSERHRVRFRFETFNLTNHPNFQLPSERFLFNSSGGRVGSAGRVTETTTTSRQIQLAIKWSF